MEVRCSEVKLEVSGDSGYSLELTSESPVNMDNPIENTLSMILSIGR